MFKYYLKTQMEEFIENLYLRNNIISPEDISIENLSHKFDISILSVPMKSSGHETKSGRFYISLDNRQTRSKQRFDFLHELGHIFRHAGNQSLMPIDFVKYQEDDADQFAFYALMPFFMIERLSFSGDIRQDVAKISQVFSVDRTIAQKRYDQIMRREYDGAFSKAILHMPRKEVDCEMEERNGVSFWVYYDESGTYDGPTQIIVTVDEKTLINCVELELPIGERLPELDQEEVSKIGGVIVSPGDIVCFDGKVTLQLNQLVFKHGLLKRTFVLHMRDIEMLMEKDRLMIQRFF